MDKLTKCESYLYHVCWCNEIILRIVYFILMSALSLKPPIDSSHRFSESVLRGLDHEEEAATVENKEAVENV